MQLSVEGNRNSKLQAARAERQHFEKISGKDTRARLAHMSAATMPTMQQLSEEVNVAMAMRYAGQGGITATCLWFKFFKEIDEDGSGRMMFDELLKMARVHLHLPETQVSDKQLQEVWRALDVDNSGFITAGEFGRFMRYGRERCSQCLVERLPGAAQALEREEGIRTRMSISVKASEEDRRYSIGHTVAGPTR